MSKSELAQKKPIKSSNQRPVQSAASAPLVPSLQGAVQRSFANSNSLNPNNILQFQRTVGNYAVQRMLNTQQSPLIQPKLAVGPANDKYEREADQIAASVKSGATPAKTGQKTSAPMVSRIQRSAPMGAEGGAVDSALESKLRQSQSGGGSLPQNVRRQIEPKLGADLGNVKVHTDKQAVQLTSDLGAKAFTHKNHIYYGKGQSPADVQLTAHEAVHTVQQGAVQQNVAQRNSQLQGEIQRSPGDGVIQRKGNVATQIAGLEQSFTPNFTPAPGAVASYSVTVAVAQGMEDFSLFTKTRTMSKIRNTIREKGRQNAVGTAMFRAPKTSAQIKTKAANKVIRAQDKRKAAQNAPADTTPTATRQKNIIDSSDATGHSWIKFNALDQGGNILKTYSFGFIPGAKVTDPTQAVTGALLHPDTDFEGDDGVRYQTTAISDKAYAKGLAKVEAIQGNLPQYSTMGYNCTKFTREIAKAAGASYPSGTGMKIPVHNVGGDYHFGDKSYMPSRLYDKLGKSSKQVDTTSPESNMLNNQNYKLNDQGVLVSPQERQQQAAAAAAKQRQDAAAAAAQLRANMTPKYVKELIEDNSHLDPKDKAAWEDEDIQLTAKMLLMLTPAQLKELYSGGDFQIAQLFQTFGLPVRGLPGVNPNFRG